MFKCLFGKFHSYKLIMHHSMCVVYFYEKPIFKEWFSNEKKLFFEVIIPFYTATLSYEGIHFKTKI